jgi:predicted DNA repair protein MutK
MSAGLFGLLDDVAALARLAAASVDDVSAAAGRATAKAAGVVVDDTAVTPQYVHGVAAQRELPIIKKIAVGSLRNKIFFILPALLVLSQFAEWALTPILMMGGTYLAFEGAEKVWERIRGHDDHVGDLPAAEHHAHVDEAEDERTLIAGAVRTDFILSAEIMVIALNEIAAEGFVSRLVILAVVAVFITLAVYGVVALIVKMDDVGLHLAERSSRTSQRIGLGLVAGMPKLLAVISTVGVAAMLWVGGHILMVGADELGWHAPYELVHHLEHEVEVALHGVGALAGLAAWLTNTIASAIIGLIVGAVVVAVMHVLPISHGAHEGAGGPTPQDASGDAPEVAQD